MLDKQIKLEKQHPWVLRNKLWINMAEILIHVLSIKGASVPPWALLSLQMWTGSVFLDHEVMSQTLSVGLWKFNTSAT